MKEQTEHRSPPIWATRLFEWCADYAHVEDLQGDLEEVFYADITSKSLFAAKINYWKQVITLIFSYALKKRKKDRSFHPLSITQNNTAMFKNYIKVALRSLTRNKFFTAINVLGLAFGMSITILYIGFMSSLIRYDKFHENFDTTYRIVSTVDQKTETRQYASAPASLADILHENYAGINEVVKINDWISGEADYKGKVIPLEGFFTEPDFFKIFTFDMLKGNVASALSEPYQIILTTSGADKLFSGADPIGKVVSFGEMGDYTVAGIMADPPKGSHLGFEVLASYSTVALLERSDKIRKVTNEWQNFGGNYTYMLLQDGQVAQVQEALNQISDSQYKYSQIISASFELQPMSKIVLGWTNYNDDIGPYFGGPAIFGFAAITLLILLPACFNYSNISISRAMKRAREIGIRKVVGGHRRQIWYQFIVETVIISLFALIGSIVIFFMIKDEFANMVAGGNTVNFEFTTIMLIAFIVFAVVTGVFAGIIPATYFSRVDPVTALKGPSGMKLFGGTSFKKVLIVSQFALSLFFIIGVLVQFKQTRYSINFDMGFDKENLLDVELQTVDKEMFRNEFSKHGAVTTISMSSGVIGAYTPPWAWLNYTDKKDSMRIREMSVDHNYISNLDLTILAGKNFDKNSADIEQSIIVNEAFYKGMGLSNPIDAIGRTFRFSDGEEVSIIGVVKDFNYALLRAPISYFVFRYNPDEFKYANIKVSTTDNFYLLSDMEDTWKALGQEEKFKARFFDSEIEEAFKTQSVMINIYGFMGGLAIVIACLGLLGMVVYSNETRAKEVGLRKVMGASVNDLIYLLSKEYIVLMMIAAVIAIPISYFFYDFVLSMEQHYSVTVGALEIILSLLMLLMIGALTMASQTIKTALANPAETLQYE